MSTVRLYTRQSDKTLLMLEHGERVLNQRVYVQLHFGDMLVKLRDEGEDAAFSYIRNDILKK